MAKLDNERAEEWARDRMYWRPRGKTFKVWQVFNDTFIYKGIYMGSFVYDMDSEEIKYGGDNF